MLHWRSSLLLNEMITSNVQALTVVESVQEVKFDQETSITDVKFTRQGESCGELRSAGGSGNVSKESPMSAGTGDASIEKSVRVKHSTSQWCEVLRRILEVHVRPGLWRSWDT